MGGVIFITALSLFHFFRNSQYPEKGSASFKNFFRKCEYSRSCYFLISSNILKKSFVLTVTGVWKKCFVSYIFQTIVVIVVIKILHKYR